MSVTDSGSGAGETSQLREVEEHANTDLLAAAPGLVRIALTAYFRTLGWSVQVSLRTVNGALRLVLSGDGANDLISGMSTQLRDRLRRLLGVTEIEQRLRQIPEDPSTNGHPADHLAALRERGTELLARSAAVEDNDVTHPAYERILMSMAPDEARILRLMATEGPRAAVDVRTWRPLDLGSELIEPGLTMIGQQAGLRYVDRTQAYLNNLYRLGLVWFSREPLNEMGAYQVLEAQPDVLAALEKAGRGRTVRRSVNLTPFGIDFCETCLPLDTASFLTVKQRASNGDGPAGDPAG